MFYLWNDYKLRLDSARLVELEAKLGNKSPLSIFTEAGENSMPPLGKLLLVLHYSLIAFNHSKKLEDTYKIYDDFVAEGGDITGLVNVIIEVFKVSGLIPKETNADEVKN
jgi:hypothetical protein